MVLQEGWEARVYLRRRIRVKLVLLLTFAVAQVALAETGSLQERLERSRWLEEELGRLNTVLVAGDPVSVLEAVDGLREEVGQDARWANLEGLALAATGDHRAAIRRFTEGLRLDPDRSALHANLAVSLVQVGATGRALSEFEQAAQLDPRSVDAHLGWGRELHRLRRHGPALEPLRRARYLAPDDLRVLPVLGDAAAAAGEVEEALEVWGRVETLAPDVRSARRLAELRAPRDPEAAIEAYDLCLDRDPDALDCREAAASLETAAGRPDAAAERLFPHAEDLSGPGLANLYVALWNAGRGGDVRALVERRPPRSGPGCGVAGLAFRAVGDTENALEMLTVGLNVAPRDPGLLVLMGAVLEDAGRRDEARAAWRRALELDADNAEARSNLEATGGLRAPDPRSK